MPNPRRATVAIVAYLLLAASVFAALAPFAGFGEGVGPFFILLAVCLFTWARIATITAETWFPQTPAKIGVFVILLPLILGFFILETNLLSLAKRHFRPRPMFANRFVHHERSLLSVWYPPIPLATGDDANQWSVADYPDNLLVIMRPHPSNTQPPRIKAEDKQVRIEWGEDGAKTEATIQAAPNALVVVLEDGTHRRFPLPPGKAESFQTACEAHEIADIFAEAVHLLAPQEQREFTRFLTDHPAPTAL